ncbi:MAG: hypothetical protein RMJ00_07070 [Nitrososphaerota archaeon]|nr:hypothetical protein [Candidatus Bathyarchaeota archaeon]MDW8062442.1 hypothetical protein [Nitrososphaerota archaeon]
MLGVSINLIVEGSRKLHDSRKPTVNPICLVQIYPYRYEPSRGYD